MQCAFDRAFGQNMSADCTLLLYGSAVSSALMFRNTQPVIPIL
jgi:hypothetical protein